jgi:hypothetical protein
MDIKTDIGSIADFLKDGMDKIWPDPERRAAAQVAILQAQQAGAFKEMDAQLAVNIEQIKANAVEAAKPGFHFRDGAGWVCVAAFAFGALKAPIEWGCALAGHPLVLPSVDQNTTIPMLLALLGLGGMHAYQVSK